MITLDKYEQQIILACKSWGDWAEKEGRFKAVKVVVSQYYALDLEDMGLYSVYHCLVGLFLKINERRISLLENFLLDIFKRDWCGGYADKIDIEHLVRKLISQISNMPVKDSKGNSYFEQLEPDYSILNKGLDDK